MTTNPTPLPTRAEVEAILERAEQASPGPWRVMPDYEDPVLYVEADIDGGVFVCGMDNDRPDDARFISAARQDVPTLAAAYLEALEVLERVIAPHLSSDVAHRRELEQARAFLNRARGMEHNDG